MVRGTHGSSAEGTLKSRQTTKRRVFHIMKPIITLLLLTTRLTHARMVHGLVRAKTMQTLANSL